jgi:hypothetical protein
MRETTSGWTDKPTTVLEDQLSVEISRGTRKKHIACASCRPPESGGMIGEERDTITGWKEVGRKSVTSPACVRRSSPWFAVSGVNIAC